MPGAVTTVPGVWESRHWTGSTKHVLLPPKARGMSPRAINQFNRNGCKVILRSGRTLIRQEGGSCV